MLHKEIPFLRILVPLCAGIIAGLYIEPDNWYIIIILLVCTLIIIYTFFHKETRLNIIFGIFLSISFVICGFLLYKIQKKGFTNLKQEKTDIICSISDFAEERENSYRVRIKLNAVIESGKLARASGSMLLYFRKDSSVTYLQPGDIIKIRCTPTEVLNRGNPLEFDYRFYLENKGIRYLSFVDIDDIKIKIVPSKRALKHRALIIREKILQMYRNRGISGRNLALVAAITVGEKSLLEQDQKERFMKAGVMHIMAVSGLHAVVLSMFVFNLLFFLKKRFRIIQILAALIILWAFAFVTGLTPSVMRATLMFSFIQAGKLLKRPPNSMNSVLASAFILIIIRPSVVFEAGFLLSYSAVIFIIAFYKEIRDIFHFKNRIAYWVWQSAALTLVAQAGTLPLTIMLFNRFPVYFLFTNLIIIPLASLLIITGSLILMLYPLAFVSGFLAHILNFLTLLTENITGLASSLPGASIEQMGMKVPESILLLAIISIAFSSITKREFHQTRFLLALILLFAGLSSVRNIITKRSNELIVYNTPGVTTVGLRAGKILYLYSSDNELAPEIKHQCAIQNISLKKINNERGRVIIKPGDKDILISEKIDAGILDKLKPDIIILSGIRPIITGLSSDAEYQGIIIASSESGSGFSLPENSLSRLRQPVHYVRRQGAFILDLP